MSDSSVVLRGSPPTKSFRPSSTSISSVAFAAAIFVLWGIPVNYLVRCARAVLYFRKGEPRWSIFVCVCMCVCIYGCVCVWMYIFCAMEGISHYYSRVSLSSPRVLVVWKRGRKIIKIESLLALALNSFLHGCRKRWRLLPRISCEAFLPATSRPLPYVVAKHHDVYVYICVSVGNHVYRIYFLHLHLTVFSWILSPKVLGLAGSLLYYKFGYANQRDRMRAFYAVSGGFQKPWLQRRERERE